MSAQTSLQTSSSPTQRVGLCNLAACSSNASSVQYPEICLSSFNLSKPVVAVPGDWTIRRLASIAVMQYARRSWTVNFYASEENVQSKG